MNPERWVRVKEIYLSARNLEPGPREAFLKNACAGDADLVTEVTSLLAQEGNSKGFFEASALDAVAGALAEDEALEPRPNLIG